MVITKVFSGLDILSLISRFLISIPEKITHLLLLVLGRAFFFLVFCLGICAHKSFMVIGDVFLHVSVCGWFGKPRRFIG